MIIYNGKKLWDPKELDSPQVLEEFREVVENDEDVFEIPMYLNILKISGMKLPVKLRVYKVGFLYESLRRVYPKLSYRQIFNIIFDKYQCHFGLRTLQNGLTDFRKYNNEFLKNVPNEYKS